jgi:hypothetical protein
LFSGEGRRSFAERDLGVFLGEKEAIHVCYLGEGQGEYDGKLRFGEGADLG